MRACVAPLIADAGPRCVSPGGRRRPKPLLLCRSLAGCEIWEPVSINEADQLASEARHLQFGRRT